MSAQFLLILALVLFGLLWFADPIVDAIARMFPRLDDEADAKIREALNNTEQKP